MLWPIPYQFFSFCSYTKSVLRRMVLWKGGSWNSFFLTLSNKVMVKSPFYSAGNKDQRSNNI